MFLESFHKYLTFVCCTFLAFQTIGQTVYLTNPSFEDRPGPNRPPVGWRDCGGQFPGETPPDVQPSGSWEVYKPAMDGDTYLGMVVRENETYESVSQAMSGPLKKGKSYSFDIGLCTSEKYLSATRASTLQGGTKYNYVTPAKLMIWGGNSLCDKAILLGESPLISNNSWQKYNFIFKPTRNVSYITLEAFYRTPVLEPYNGNLLVDNASPITEILPKEKEPVAIKALTKKIVPGQVIRLDELYFQADNATLNKNSFKILDELYAYLAKNQSVKIEIGGHTNGVPSVEYCDKLSTERAKEVASYLTKKGINKTRVTFKGYGKRNPLASDKTMEGRKKNQRVEIKILST